MEGISGLVESTKAILLFGFEENDSNLDTGDAEMGEDDDEVAELDSETLQRIKRAADDFLTRSSNESKNDAILKENLSTMLATLEKEQAVKDTTELLALAEKFIRLQLKIQHMSLIKAMHQLRRYKSVHDIPGLIFAVRNDVPVVLLAHSRIKKVVLETVNEVKGDILIQFHKLLDEHLVAAQKDPEMGSTAQRSSANSSSASWVSFLSQARAWLLAYTMVNLLPTVLTETSGMILEKFQDTLDGALTPTWGRYYYHLQVARKARSSEQIMWTFDYTRSFVRMMCDLSCALTSSGELQRLCDLDYAAAGQKQVLDKAAKFMRAHLAQIVEDFSPMSRELCMQLVEETLGLDEWIHSIANEPTVGAVAGARTTSHNVPTGTGNGTNVSSNKTPLTICPVLFDAKEMFHQWLLAEHRFFYFELRGKCREVRKVFSFEFGDAGKDRFADPTDEENYAIYAHEDVKGAPYTPREGQGQLRCYKGVYECMNLFFIGCERYKYLPPQAQRGFSVCVLEPLLCTALGLLLYKTRSNAVLFQISMGTYKPALVSIKTQQPQHQNSGNNSKPAGKVDIKPTPPELQEYYDSAHYFQSCLGASARRNLVSHTALQFRTSLWSELQSWMPQVLISEQELKNGFSPVDLIDKAWKLSEEFGTDHQYAYRYPAAQLLQKSASFLRGAGGSGVNSRDTSAKSKPAGATSGAGAAAAAGEAGEIGECVDVARGLAITLCNVLKEQLANCK